MIGQTISHYKILEKLGEGGMGVVYKAEDTKLDRIVALKFLPERLSSSAQDKARFILEAKAASSLNHPNVCTIHDISEHDGQMFMVMEFVDGQTLRDLVGSIHESFLPLKRTIDIGIQVADGLSAAHEKGIVHRDIKPENIMIRKDGIAQIMDFGLAKLRASGSKISRLTKEGSTVGTAGYMSPEQVQGLDSDHRSDIFSLGVLLYELFAGQLPFKGVHETALAYEIVNVDPAPMSAVKPEIDPSLDAIVLECMEKDPNERTQSVKQISVDLKRYKRESSRQRVSRVTSARPAMKKEEMNPIDQSESSGRKQIFWPIVTIILLIALIVVGWSLWKKDSRSLLVTRLTVLLPKDQMLSTTSYSPAALSPDGSQLVYKANGKLYLRNLNSFEATPIPGAEDGSGPFFSPDGKWIGFFASGKLKKIPVSGGASTVLADATDNRGSAWGSNGDIVFAPITNVGLTLVRDDGGNLRQLTNIDTTKNERTHRWPSFLPDGKTVLYTIGSMDSPDFYDDAVVEAINIETGKRKVVMKGGCSAQYIETGFLVYWRSSSLFAVPFDIDKLEVTGTSFPIVENVNGDQTTGMAGYTIAKNGMLAYSQGYAGFANQSLVRIEMNGKVTLYDAPIQSYQEPSISPDGKHIAVAIQSGKDIDIWIYDIPRNFLSKLTFGGLNRTPQWSPDGKRIAYYFYNGGKQSIAFTNADGSGSTELIETPSGRSYIDSWSKDGSLLILDRVNTTVAASTGGSDIFSLSLKGEPKLTPFLTTKFDEWEASLSPDGKWLAYVSNESGSYQVYIQPFPTGSGKWQVSTDEGFEPHWAPDGKTLYYYNSGRIMTVPVQSGQSLVTGKPQVLINGYFKRPTDSGLNYSISPDGQYFITTNSTADDDNLRQINIVQNWFDEIKNKTAVNK